jgi:hypothetical protein
LGTTDSEQPENVVTAADVGSSPDPDSDSEPTERHRTSVQRSMSRWNRPCLPFVFLGDGITISEPAFNSNFNGIIRVRGYSVDDHRHNLFLIWAQGARRLIRCDDMLFFIDDTPDMPRSEPKGSNLYEWAAQRYVEECVGMGYIPVKVPRSNHDLNIWERPVPFSPEPQHRFQPGNWLIINDEPKFQFDFEEIICVRCGGRKIGFGSFGTKCLTCAESHDDIFQPILLESHSDPGLCIVSGVGFDSDSDGFEWPSYVNEPGINSRYNDAIVILEGAINNLGTDRNTGRYVHQAQKPKVTPKPKRKKKKSRGHFMQSQLSYDLGYHDGEWDWVR